MPFAAGAFLCVFLQQQAIAQIYKFPQIDIVNLYEFSIIFPAGMLFR